MKIILIMGLPGSGKTTLANELAPLLNAKRLNADEVRKDANDWDFSEEGRKRQAKRMADFALKMKEDGSYVVVDFICPTPEARKLFPADYVVWVDTIQKGRFEDTNQMFVKPEKYYGNRYSVMLHGIGLCDEWPAIRYPTDGGERSGVFETNMTITVESYIGKVGGNEGVKLEQQYLVGQNSLELMSHHPLEDI